LIVTGSTNETLHRAVANLGNVFVCPADSLTTYYVARAHKVLLTPEAVENFQKKFSQEREVTQEVESVPAPKKEKKVTVKKVVAEKKTVKKPAKSKGSTE
jgi:hypothetical protein